MGELNRDSIDLALPQCSLCLKPVCEECSTIYCVNTPTREDVETWMHRKLNDRIPPMFEPQPETTLIPGGPKWEHPYRIINC